MVGIRHICFYLLLPLLLFSLEAATPPPPCGATPTEQQVKWLRMEWYAFVHFGLNTYTGREWGYGDESPALFRPSRFDAELIVRLIRRLQPNCIIWGAEGRGDVVWGGSEKGHVPYPCWNVSHPGDPREKWLSLEGDTPINRAGWFWHPGQSEKVKSPETLMRVYLDSVGRGANLILNLAPNRDGELDAADVASLIAFAEMRWEFLSQDYAKGAQVEASEVRGNSPLFQAGNLVDGDIETYWCPEDGTTQAEIILKLPSPVTFDVVRLREQIRLGQRVRSFRLEAMQEGKWEVIDSSGQTIGHQVMRTLSAPVTTDRVRLVITDARACPCLSEMSLLRLPSPLPRVEISRRGKELHLLCKRAEGDLIYYTLDGSEPTTASAVYSAPVTLPDDFCGLVRAVCVSSTTGRFGSPSEKRLPLSSQGWKAMTPAAESAIDDDPATFWHSSSSQSVACEVDMDRPHLIRAFSYLPRQDGVTRDMTHRYLFEVSEDGHTWKEISKGSFDNLRANPIEHIIDISPTSARYWRFVPSGSLDGEGVSAAEIRIFTSDYR